MTTTPDTQRIAAIIPAYNEADLIADTLLATSAIPGVVGVIVANDASRDNTANIAARSGALVVSNTINSGKGAALELAAQSLEQLRPFGELDGILLLDGDLGTSASAASPLLQTLASGAADMVVATLPAPPGKAGFGMVKGLARDTIANYGDGFIAQAPLSGQRALTLECFTRVRPFAKGYGVEVAMTVKALQQKLRVLEVPTTLSHRHYGRNLKGFIHRGKQFMDIYHLANSLRRDNQ